MNLNLLPLVWSELFYLTLHGPHVLYKFVTHAFQCSFHYIYCEYIQYPTK